MICQNKCCNSETILLCSELIFLCLKSKIGPLPGRTKYSDCQTASGLEKTDLELVWLTLSGVMDPSGGVSDTSGRQHAGFRLRNFSAVLL